MYITLGVNLQPRICCVQHFLYTGNSNKTSNELFMIVDANSRFLTRGYEAAVAAKKEREGKGKDAYGSKSNQYTNIKEVCCNFT